ncbi:Aspartate aminotransferase, cytoplasmic, partial [Ophiophagus hannah]
MQSEVALMRPSLFRVPLVSLGEDADDETHVVAVESRNMASIPEPVPIVALKHPVLPMVCLDGFELLPPVSFILKSGMGPVYLHGQHLILEDDSDYEPTDDDIPDDADVDEDSFDEEEIPSPEMPAVRCHTDNADETWIPPVVQKILLQIPQDPTLDHEYIGELGIVEFTKTAMELVIGKNNQAFLDNRRRHLFPFFDVAAQGLASGDLDRDAWAVRLFVNKGFELFCAQSFSKTFGLYDERVGNLIVVTTDNQTLIRIHSQIARLISVTWFGPTSLGARVITMVLNSPAHFYECWRSIKVKSISFSLPASQVEFLEKHKHIYLLANGQINICSINSKNLGYIAQSIHEAILVTTCQNPSYLCITAHQEPEKSSVDLSDSP